jgi:hypothetical protein
MAAIKADNIHSANTSIDGSYINGDSTPAQFIFRAEYAVSDKFGITIDWRVCGRATPHIQLWHRV